MTPRGFQCFVLNAFVCTEKFVKGITTNTAQIFVTTGFRISVSNSLINLPLTLQGCKDEFSQNCYFVDKKYEITKRCQFGNA